MVEDSQHSYDSTTSALNFFGNHLKSGEYLVIEDGILDDQGWSEQYGGGPNKAIKIYVEKNPNLFEIDEAYCDMFGKNLTYNPNGYLLKK